MSFTQLTKVSLFYSILIKTTCSWLEIFNYFLEHVLCKCLKTMIQQVKFSQMNNYIVTVSLYNVFQLPTDFSIQFLWIKFNFLYKTTWGIPRQFRRNWKLFYRHYSAKTTKIRKSKIWRVRWSWRISHFYFFSYRRLCWTMCVLILSWLKGRPKTGRISRMSTLSLVCFSQYLSSWLFHHVRVVRSE